MAQLLREIRYFEWVWQLTTSPERVKRATNGLRKRKQILVIAPAVAKS